MSILNVQEIKERFAEPFAAADLEWRLQWTNEDFTSGRAVPYVTNRAIQNRLDEVVGPQNWKNEFRPWHDDPKSRKSSQLCGISIYFEDRKEWVCKWDGAEDSDVESVKGGLSDSMKRCAVQWGIGRILYSLDAVFVEVEKKGKSVLIKDSERAKLDRRYLDMLAKLGKRPAAPIGEQSTLTPRNTGAGPAGEQKPTAAQPQPKPQTARQSAPTQQSAPAQPTSGAVPQSAAGQETPFMLYVVEGKKVQPSTGGASTSNLRLRDPQGKTIDAFMRGDNPGIVAGTRLANVKLSRKTSGSIIYHTIDSFEIAA